LRDTVAVGGCTYTAIGKLDIESHTGGDGGGRLQRMPVEVADKSISTLEHFSI
jgi:hypothetical protein